MARSQHGVGATARQGATGQAVVEALLWYRTLFEQTALGVVVADGDRRLMEFNDAYCRILGRSRDDLHGRRVSDFGVPGDQDECPEAVAELVAGAPSRTIEKRYLRADGTQTWVRVTLSALSVDHQLYGGIVEDIAASKDAEAQRVLALAELRDKTALLERAHGLADIGTFVIDMPTARITLSAELAKMLGAAGAPLDLPLAAYDERFVHAEDPGWGALLAEHRGAGTVAWERRLVRADGRVIWAATHAGYDGDDGRRVMGVVQDVTERIELVDALRGSRARIAAAAERERLRVEHDLHDGAQQRLIALEVKLVMARQAAGPDAMRAQLDEISHDLEATIDELRALAHGIYPTILRDRGLAEAFRGLARQAPMPVHLVQGQVGRCSPAVETAVYFCAHEALQNVTKHAGATARITLTIRPRDQGLVFEIADDGAGFVPDAHPDALGLASMRDRIDAVGGTLEILSAPGAGTRVRGTVPVRGTPRAVNPQPFAVTLTDSRG